MSENEMRTEYAWPVKMTVTESRTFTAYVAAESQAMAEFWPGLIDVPSETVCGGAFLDDLAETYGDYEMRVTVTPSEKLFGGPAARVEFDADGVAVADKVNGCPVLDLPSSWLKH